MKRNQLVLLQVLLWGLLFTSNLWLSFSKGFLPTGNHYGIPLFPRYFIMELGYIAISVTCFYGSYLLVAPRLFGRLQIPSAIMYFLAILAGIVSLRYVIEYHFFLPVLGFDNYNGRLLTPVGYIENCFFYYFPRYFVYGLMYFFAKSWYYNRHLKQELEKERSEAELAFLRSQLNPHFLFNTLNDIYTLTYKKSDDAPDALLKLSELLRYMLREGNENFMPLSAEMRYLENLVELQRISAKGNAFIDFTCEGIIADQRVASLLFVSFVENAFKHGVLTDPANPVQVSLKVVQDEIRFRVMNKKNHDQKDKTGGIGLQNVCRRLELICPESHTLTINDLGEHYTADLVLKLN